jgi:hypothetical protein
MSKANGGTTVKSEAREAHNGKTATVPPDLGVPADGGGRRVLRTAVAVGYVPIAVTEQLLARSQPLAYYAGVLALATAGVIEWPVAGVVATGVWVARHHSATPAVSPAS